MAAAIIMKLPFCSAGFAMLYKIAQVRVNVCLGVSLEQVSLNSTFPDILHKQCC